MATVNGTIFSDNNTVNGNGLFHPILVGKVDPAFMIINGVLVFTPDRPDTINGLDGNDIIHALGTNDTRNGGPGPDHLRGFADNKGDAVTETVPGGTDTVNSSILSYTLGNFLNNLNLTGAAISGKGNSLNNIINGNGANNILSGEGGSDTLNGGAGADFIAGGAGNDMLTRSGLANSDSRISGNLAQSKSVKFAAKKEREYEKDEKESRSGIQSQGGNSCDQG